MKPRGRPGTAGQVDTVGNSVLQQRGETVSRSAEKGGPWKILPGKKTDPRLVCGEYEWAVGLNDGWLWV